MASTAKHVLVRDEKVAALGEGMTSTGVERKAGNWKELISQIIRSSRKCRNCKLSVTISASIA